MTSEPWYWRARDTLSPDKRARVRRGVDGLGSSLVGSIRRAEGTSRIAMTLDDGPDPSITPAVLDELRTRKVHASFFILVRQARLHRDVVRQIALEGHDVCLHGLDHRPVRGMPFVVAVKYLREARRELEEIAGTDVRYFRPTFGSQSLASYLAARMAGLDVVVWTTDVADWEQRREQDVIQDALATPAGGILLFHDRLDGWLDRRAAADGLDRVLVIAGILDGWIARGCTPSSITEVVAEGRVRRSVWFRP